MPPPSNVKKMREEIGELLELSARLWDDHCSQPPPKAVADLWTEHLSIRSILDQMAVKERNLTLKTVSSQKSLLYYNEDQSSECSRMKDIESLNAWATQSGIVNNGVQLVSMFMQDAAKNQQKHDTNAITGCEALGLQASVDLSVGDIVVRVPRSAAITWTNVLNCSALSKALECDPIVGRMPNVAMALFLLIELMKGNASEWAPYLRTLPKAYSTPLFWSADELSLLKHSPCFVHVLRMYRAIARQFAYFYIQMSPKASRSNRLGQKEFGAFGQKEQIFATTPLSLGTFTFRAYKWAVSTVTTRVNMIPDQHNAQPIPALLPIIDMANHDAALAPQANASDGDHITLEFDVETDSALCYATRAVQSGDPFCIYYGQRSNMDFLLHNGFVPSNNTNAAYALKLGLNKSDGALEQRRQLLTEMGLSDNTEYEIDQSAQPITQPCLLFVMVFVAPTAAGLNQTNIQTADNRQRAFEYLRQRLDLMGKMAEKSISGLPKDLTENGKMCETLLRSELACLLNAKLYCEKQLKKAD